MHTATEAQGIWEKAVSDGYWSRLLLQSSILVQERSGDNSLGAPRSELRSRCDDKLRWLEEPGATLYERGYAVGFLKFARPEMEPRLAKGLPYYGDFSREFG